MQAEIATSRAAEALEGGGATAAARAVAGFALIAFGLWLTFGGGYWDISYHVAWGRDAFLSFQHLEMAFGVNAAALGALVAGSATWSPARALRDPVGLLRSSPGLLQILACGFVAFLALPLDEIWHRLFGVDVTVWGPTHLLFIVAVAFATVGVFMLVHHTAEQVGFARQRDRVAIGLFKAVVAAGLLVGLSVPQTPFEFGASVNPLMLHVAAIAFAAGAGLTWARLAIGPGGALFAVLVFFVLRGALAAFLGLVVELPVPVWALYVVEAIVVELAFRAAPGSLGRVAALVAVGIGTFGVLAEWLWSRAVMPDPWPASLLPAGIVAGTAVAWGGATLAARMGVPLLMRLHGAAPAGPRPVASLAAVAAAAAVFLIVLVPDARPTDTRVAFEPRPLSASTAALAIELRPRTAADGAEWIKAFSIRSDGRRRRTDLREVAPGRYVAAAPIPLGAGDRSWVQVGRGRDRYYARVPEHAATRPLRPAHIPGLSGRPAVTAFAYGGLALVLLGWMLVVRLTLRQFAAGAPQAASSAASHASR
jgi:hypothetical protein